MRDNSQIELLRDANINAAANHLAEMGFIGSGDHDIHSYTHPYLRFGIYADQICTVQVEQDDGTAVWRVTALFTMAAINTWADVYVGLAPQSDDGIYTLSWPFARIRLSNPGAVNTTVFDFRAVARKWR